MADWVRGNDENHHAYMMPMQVQRKEKIGFRIKRW